ncbi:hypothetical protein OXX80_006301 [Metschnikowia pulcherrima]
MSILFTTGATVTFRPLLDEITNPDFLEPLANAGFRTISIQYGNEISATGANLSKSYFSELLASKGLVEHFDLEIANEFNDKSVTIFRNSKFTLRAFGFANNINTYISQADLVVSHAGTGSILDTLRSKKPLIVVTNDSLMDNHQAEIAARFEAENYLVKVTEAELKKGLLGEKIQSWKNGEISLDSLPDPPAGVLENVIAEELEKC